VLLSVKLVDQVAVVPLQMLPQQFRLLAVNQLLGKEKTEEQVLLDLTVVRVAVGLTQLVLMVQVPLVALVVLV
jgi:hypothetical protein